MDPYDRIPIVVPITHSPFPTTQTPGKIQNVDPLMGVPITGPAILSWSKSFLEFRI